MEPNKIRDRALLALKKMEAKLAALERERTESIAVISCACRFPAGASSPEAYWQNLLSKVDAIGPIPMQRWSISAGADDPNRGKYVGGFIEGVDEFDSAFFGISPREANSMDPQQRVLLEVSSEAFERGGLTPESLKDSATGVFIGAVALDYRDRFVACAPEELGTYALTGNLLSVIAGRISYVFGLMGPCVTVETACSSSLVAVHQACQSLRMRESNLALAGGVNLLLSPVNMNMLAGTKTLSPQGRCATFDAGADGLVRGEGCGVVVMKRLSDAERDGDQILAIIRGSAVNHDGRAAGLTAPNVLSQQALLVRALEVSRVGPEEVGYVETHGTGTALGDPIEFQALKNVFGQRPEGAGKCVLGSVKSNVGHLEAAAGIAGLLKVILALQYETIPAQLHYQKTNPNIELDGSPFIVPSDTVVWKRGTKRRIAGVSSFGISGTNAHVVLEEGPPLADMLEEGEGPQIFPVSARSPEALSKFAEKYDAALADNGALAGSALRAIAYSAGVHRAHYEYRMAVTAASRTEVREALTAYRTGTPHAGLTSGKVSSGIRHKIAFVFPGLGSQWCGMGLGLLSKEAAFRETIELCDAAIRRRADWSLLDELNAPAEKSQLHRIEIVQPALFSLGVALASQWRAWGIVPGAVVGHSMGEVAAAYTAGAIDLEVAVRIICERSRIMSELAGKGAMAIAEVAWDLAHELVVPYKGRISVAGSNSARFTVFSGEADALQDLWNACHKEKVFFRMIKDAIPSHSHLVESVLPRLRERLSGIEANDGPVAFYSTVYGGRIGGATCGVDYWLNNLRKPVRFDLAAAALVHDGYTDFVELGAHPALLPALGEAIQKEKSEARAYASLRQGIEDRRSMLDSLGQLYVNGVMPDWPAACGGDARVAPLPTYPWQHRKHWVAEAPFTGRARWGPTTAEAEALEPVDPDIPRVETDDRLFLRVDWRLSHLVPQASTSSLRGRWLVLVDDGGAGQQLADLLRERGQEAILVTSAKLRGASRGDIEVVDPVNPLCFDDLLARYFSNSDACAGLVHMWSMDGTSTPQFADAQRRGCGALLHLLQAVGRTNWRDLPRLFLVTRGAQPAGLGGVVSGLDQTPILGMGQALCYELPELRCARIDCSAQVSGQEITALANEILSSEQEDLIALRPEGRYVARLIQGLPGEPEISVGRGVGTRNEIRLDGTYLVTGGLGALGLKLAHWLAERGAGALVLLSRRGAVSAEQKAAVASLQARGVKVATPSADVADHAQLSAAWETVRPEMPPLKGVVHAAGILDDGFVHQQTLSRLQRVLATKVQGAWNLHSLTEKMDLDFFVLYSSASALIGSPGQTNYAAANAFLDALAQYRKARGLPALSVQWGVFSDVGLATETDNRAARLAYRGMAGLTADVAFEALSRLLGGEACCVGVVPFNIRQWIEFYPQVASSPYLSKLVEQAPSPESRSSIVTTLCEIPKLRRRGAVADFVRKQVSIVLLQNETVLEANTPFRDFGMDSLTGLELRNRLEAAFELRLSAALIWTYSNIHSLASYLHEQVAQRLESSGLGAGETEGSPSDKSEEEQLIERLKQQLAG